MTHKDKAPYGSLPPFNKSYDDMIQSSDATHDYTLTDYLHGMFVNRDMFSTCVFGISFTSSMRAFLVGSQILRTQNVPYFLPYPAFLSVFPPVDKVSGFRPRIHRNSVSSFDCTRTCVCACVFFFLSLFFILCVHVCACIY